MGSNWNCRIMEYTAHNVIDMRSPDVFKHAQDNRASTDALVIYCASKNVM